MVGDLLSARTQSSEYTSDVEFSVSIATKSRPFSLTQASCSVNLLRKLILFSFSMFSNTSGRFSADTLCLSVHSRMIDLGIVLDGEFEEERWEPEAPSLSRHLDFIVLDSEFLRGLELGEILLLISRLYLLPLSFFVGVAGAWNESLNI